MNPAVTFDIMLFAAYLAASSVGLLLLKQSLVRLRLSSGPMLTVSADTLMLAGSFFLYVLSFGLWLRILARLSILYLTSSSASCSLDGRWRGGHH